MLSKSLGLAQEDSVDSALLNLKAQLPFPMHLIPRQQEFRLLAMHQFRCFNLRICSSWSFNLPVDRFTYI